MSSQTTVCSRSASRTVSRQHAAAAERDRRRARAQRAQHDRLLAPAELRSPYAAKNDAIAHLELVLDERVGVEHVVERRGLAARP